jgi:hypothetical protein
LPHLSPQSRGRYDRRVDYIPDEIAGARIGRWIGTPKSVLRLPTPHHPIESCDHFIDRPLADSLMSPSSAIAAVSSLFKASASISAKRLVDAIERGAGRIAAIKTTRRTLRTVSPCLILCRHCSARKRVSRWPKSGFRPYERASLPFRISPLGSRCRAPSAVLLLLGPPPCTISKNDGQRSWER